MSARVAERREVASFSGPTRFIFGKSLDRPAPDPPESHTPRASMSESFGQSRIERRAGDFAVADTWHAPGLVLYPHEHEHACLHFVIAGVYRETSGGSVHAFDPGHVLYKPAGFRHANRFEGCGARTVRVEVAGDCLARLGLRAATPVATRAPELVPLGRRLHRELLGADDLTPLVLEGLTLELLGGLFRAIQPVLGRSRAVEDCAALLRERFRDAWSAAAVARELGCDRSGLARGFRRRFGLTMGEYVRRLRVAEAMLLLEQGQSLAEASVRAGFSDQSHCTRVFRRATGTTPGKWLRSTHVPGGHRRSRREDDPG